MASRSQTVKEVSVSKFIPTPSSSFTSVSNNHCSEFSTHIPDSLVFPGHVVNTQTLEGGTSSALSSPPLSPRMKKNSKILTKVNHSSGLLTGPENLSQIHYGTQFAKTRANPSHQNKSGTVNITEKNVGSHMSHGDFNFACTFVAKSNPDSHQNGDSNSEDTSQGTGCSIPLSPYVHDEFVYYEYSENDDCDDESPNNQKSLESNLINDGNLASFSLEVNSLTKNQGCSLEKLSNWTEAAFPIKASEMFSLSNSKQNPSNLNSTRPAPIADDIQMLESDILKASSATTALRVPKEEVLDSAQHRHHGPKKIRFKFKKLIPAESIEEYLSKTESLSYEELYHRTANVALLMTKLQEEARMIDKEINDFETAKKSDQQIAMEEAKFEKEQAQREDDKIFSTLLRNYGNFSRSRIDEWTDFHENFYENHPEENPKNYRLVLLLRNPQYINDFHKRTVAREKARLKAKTVKLVNTIDSPLSKMEQKAVEESDRKKRKPATDPLVFEDRKMADVYGLTYKVGGAYVGNQPLRDRSGFLKGEISVNNLDENSRPRRSRGKKGNYDTDQSDNTPVVSDAEEMAHTKRTRSSKAFRDPTTSPRAASRTAPSSRESTPSTVSKIFPSGKRVGRPAGSKSQVKLPSKLKSVQAVGEVASVSGENKSDIPAVNEKNKPTCPPAIIIEQYDQVIERNLYERQSDEGKNCSETCFNEANTPVEPEPLLKTKEKAKRPRKSPTQKNMKKSGENLKPHSKRRATDPKKKKSATKLDSDILPSTEVGDSVNGFLSVSFSRPSSSSSTDTRSAMDQSHKRSVSKTSGPIIKQEKNIKNEGDNPRQGAESEIIIEGIQSDRLAKKHQRDIPISSPNSEKATGLSDDKDVSKSPRKVFQVTSNYTAQDTLLIDVKNEDSRDLGIHTPFVKNTAPTKTSVSFNPEENEDTIVSNNECLISKVRTSKKSNINSRNEDCSSPYRKRRKLSGIINQKSYVPGLPQESEPIQDMYQMNSQANSNNEQVATNIANTSSFGNPGGEISTILARNSLPPNSRDGSRITVHSDNHHILVSCDKAPQKNVCKIDEICRKNQEPSAQIIMQNGKTALFHENNEFLPAEQNYSQSPNSSISLPSIQVRSQLKSSMYNTQAEVSESTLETSSYKLPPISTEASPTFSGAVQASSTTSSNSLGPRSGSRSEFPSKRLHGFDGTNDEPVQVREHRLSEYEKFQALISPTGSLSLGKRQRKLRVDLAFQDRIFEEI